MIIFNPAMAQVLIRTAYSIETVDISRAIPHRAYDGIVALLPTPVHGSILRGQLVAHSRRLVNLYVWDCLLFIFFESHGHSDVGCSFPCGPCDSLERQEFVLWFAESLIETPSSGQRASGFAWWSSHDED